MHVNSTGTMPAGTKTGLSGFRPPLTTKKTKKKQRMQHPCNSASLNALFWQIQKHGTTSFTKTRKLTQRQSRFIRLAKEQCRDGQTETHHWSWWASGSRCPLLSWWPLCRNNIQSHMAYNTLGTWSAQCISVMASYCIQPSARHLKTCIQVTGKLILPRQGMFICPYVETHSKCFLNLIQMLGRLEVLLTRAPLGPTGPTAPRGPGEP